MSFLSIYERVLQPYEELMQEAAVTGGESLPCGDAVVQFLAELEEACLDVRHDYYVAQEELTALYRTLFSASSWEYLELHDRRKFTRLQQHAEVVIFSALAGYHIRLSEDLSRDHYLDQYVLACVAGGLGVGRSCVNHLLGCDELSESEVTRQFARLDEIFAGLDGSSVTELASLQLDPGTTPHWRCVILAERLVSQLGIKPSASSETTTSVDVPLPVTGAAELGFPLLSLKQAAIPVSCLSVYPSLSMLLARIGESTWASFEQMTDKARKEFDPTAAACCYRWSIHQASRRDPIDGGSAAGTLALALVYLAVTRLSARKLLIDPSTTAASFAIKQGAFSVVDGLEEKVRAAARANIRTFFVYEDELSDGRLRTTSKEERVALLPTRGFVDMRRYFLEAYSGLYGRSSLIAKAYDLLDSGTPLLTLSGFGGVGKTSVLTSIVDNLTHSPDLNVIEIDVRARLDANAADTAFSAKDFATFFRDVVDPNDHHETKHGDVIDQVERALRSTFRTKRVVIAVDNVDKLARFAPQTIGRWATLPNVQFLVTSREALNCAHEHIEPVLPLELPPAVATSEEERRSPAVCMLVRRAHPDVAIESLSDTDVTKYAELAAGTGGIPQAIEYAASYLAYGETRDDVLQRLRLLRIRSPQGEDFVASCIGSMCDTLSANEQRALFALASVPDGFDVALACSLTDKSRLDALDLLNLLSRRHFIERTILASGEPWYFVNPPFRRYIRNKLRPPGSVDSGVGSLTEVELRAWRQFFCELLCQCKEKFGKNDSKAVFGRLERHYRNTLSYLSSMLDAGDPQGPKDLANYAEYAKVYVPSAALQPLCQLAIAQSTQGSPLWLDLKLLQVQCLARKSVADARVIASEVVDAFSTEQLQDIRCFRLHARVIHYTRLTTPTEAYSESLDCLREYNFSSRDDSTEAEATILSLKVADYDDAGDKEAGLRAARRSHDLFSQLEMYSEAGLALMRGGLLLYHHGDISGVRVIADEIQKTLVKSDDYRQLAGAKTNLALALVCLQTRPTAIDAAKMARDAAQLHEKVRNYHWGAVNKLALGVSLSLLTEFSNDGLDTLEVAKSELEAITGDGSSDVRHACYEIGAARLRLGRVDDAVPALSACWDGMQSLQARQANAALLHLDCLHRLGRPEEAEQIAQKLKEGDLLVNMHRDSQAVADQRCWEIREEFSLI